MESEFPLSELLKFKKIITDFIDKSDKLAPFVHDFLDEKNLENRIETKFLSPVNRLVLSESILKSYDGVEACKEVFDHIHLLKDSRTFTVTTGHQLNILTGPLFFLIKILQTITLAKGLKSRFPGYNFIPIYWMATEDHDLEEIRKFKLFKKEIAWETNQRGAVGEMNTEGIPELVEGLKDFFKTNKEALSILNKIRIAYETSNNLADATRRMIHSLLPQEGLVILDANKKELKQLFVQQMSLEVKEQVVESELKKSSKLLEENGYHQQVYPREINLFYLEPNSRERILKVGENLFQVKNREVKWSQKELLQELELNSQSFSPNAVLRPVYQEAILPNLVTVGGPGEISYWLQLKDLFRVLRVDFPILTLRNSHLFINEKQTSILNHFALKINDIFTRKEDLISLVSRKESGFQLEEEKKLLEGVQRKINEKLLVKDASLAPRIESAFLQLTKSMEKIENKVVKLDREKNDRKFKQLENLIEELYPSHRLNERSVNFLEILNYMPLEKIIFALKRSSIIHEPKLFINSTS